jgi:predicted lipase
MRDAYMKYPELKLIICGHSLGGALALMCYSYFIFSDSPRRVDAVYTVGQPPVGNKHFAQHLKFASPKTKYIRITNNQDIVPSLKAPKSEHFGIHVHIKSNGKFVFVSYLV